MRIRTALIIAILLVMSIFLVPSGAAVHKPNQKRTVVRVKPEPLPWQLTLAAATTTTTTTPPTTTTTTAPPVPDWDTVTPYERAAWDRVAVCEEGGWVGYAGDAYPNSLGINATNWAANGGWNPPPGVDPETPDWQIMVAEKIQSYAPDQHGCASW